MTKKMDVVAKIQAFVQGYNGELKKWPKPKQELITAISEDGVLLVFEVIDDCCRPVRQADLSRFFLRYGNSELCKPDFMLTPNMAKQIAETWMALSNPIELKDIKSFKFKGEDGYCFHKIPFDAMEGKTPLFDELMSRTSNNEAMQAWIGGLFVKGSTRHQYCWLTGKGGNGKGCMLRLLNKILGSSMVSKMVPSQGENHWTSSILGKRLVAFPDVNGGAYPRSGHFKMISGGDPIEINPKNQPMFTTYLDCKFMFQSNNTPQIGELEADKRRAIVCEIDPVRIFETDYENRLWLEAPYIVFNCIKKYHALTDLAGNIKIEDGSLESSQEWLDDDCHQFWAKYFIYNRSTAVATARVHAFLKNAGYTTPTKQADMYRWLEKFGCKRKIMDRQKVLTNIAVRVAPLQDDHGKLFGPHHLVPVANREITVDKTGLFTCEDT